MQDLNRYYPPDKEVLRNVNLSFFPGAKIGVIGHNGSGKSSLLKIMAGLDDEFTGVARLSAGYSVGYLPQEPHLDDSKDVRGNVMDGVGDTVALQEEYDALLASYADPDADYEKIGARQAELEAKMAASGTEDVDRTVDIAMDALRCPPGDSAVTTSPVASAAASRSPASCCRSPICCCSTSPPTTSTPTRWRGSNARSRTTPGTVVAITHDRYFLDNVAGWILELDRGRGYPYEGNYSGWLEQKQARLEAEDNSDMKRRETLKRELEWIRSSPKAKQSKGKARIKSLRGAPGPGRRRRRSAREARDRHPAGQSSRRRRHRVRQRVQGVRRPAPDRRPHLQAPAGRHRRRHRRQRRRQDDAVQDDHRQREARRRRHHHRQDGRTLLRRPGPRRPRRRQDRVRGDHRRRRQPR